jgi:hypothetical protein
MSDFRPLPGHNQVTTNVVPGNARGVRAKILRVLEDGAEHTTRELMESTGSMRVGARILELREMGHPIDTIQRTPTVFAYRLRKDGGR